MINSNQILMLSFFLLQTLCFSQRIAYHEFYQTASENHIKQWNIDSVNLPNTYVKETTDNENRVSELMFYKNGTLEYDHLCYLSIWIKYEYPNDTTIIETCFDFQGNESAELECGMPSQTLYYLSRDKKKIKRTESRYVIDTTLYIETGWSKKELSKLIQELEASSRIKTNQIVSNYSMSYYKLDGFFPISDEFNISHYLFSNEEKQRIEDCLLMRKKENN